MCNPPYDPKVNNSASKFITTEAATYTSPFGEENSDTRPTTRAKSRTNQRTPFVQSAPQLLPTHVKRPRSRRKPQIQPCDTTSATSFQMFLSLPNTPDTEDPLKIDHRYNNVHRRPHLFPGLSSESYIWIKKNPFNSKPFPKKSFLNQCCTRSSFDRIWWREHWYTA